MIKLSASSIAAFGTCPTKFRLEYVEKLKPIETTDNLRMGTNWHKLHEVWADNVTHYTAKEVTLALVRDNSLSAVLVHLDDTYSRTPDNKTAEEWACEKEILKRSFTAYLGHYADDEIEILATEIPFELPLHEPRTGMPLPVADVVRVGKIDAIIRSGRSVGAFERKSTSQSLDADSQFWVKWSKDTQCSMYALAMADMRLTFANHLVEGDSWGNIIVDVWRKPTIGPKMLTQGDSAAFVQTGEYCGEKFSVGAVDLSVSNIDVQVNGVMATCEPGKKAGTFAIRETPEMFGARLALDMKENPDKYFQRREIARTERELAEFREELYAIYRTMKLMDKYNTYYSNFSSCTQPYRCQFVSVCYGGGAKSVCDGESVPPGFKRLGFVDLTVAGSVVE